jgi:hypothetical protein
MYTSHVLCSLPHFSINDVFFERIETQLGVVCGVHHQCTPGDLRLAACGLRLGTPAMFCGVHHQCCVWCTPVTCQLSAKSAKHSSNTVFLGIDFIRHAISVQMVEVFKPKLCAFLVHHTTRTHSASVWQLCCVTALHHLHTTYTRCRGQATSVALGFVGERRG